MRSQGRSNECCKQCAGVGCQGPPASNVDNLGIGPVGEDRNFKVWIHISSTPLINGIGGPREKVDRPVGLDAHVIHEIEEVGQASGVDIG